MRTFSFVKNVKGGLSFELDSYDMTLPRKTFSIPYNVDKIVVPEQYALGLFISEDALQAFEQGYFTVDQYEELERMGEAIGLTAARTPRHVYTGAEITKAVVTGDMAVLDDILNSTNPIDISNLMVIVNSMMDQIPGGVISKIENACGVDLRVE